MKANFAIFVALMLTLESGCTRGNSLKSPREPKPSVTTNVDSNIFDPVQTSAQPEKKGKIARFRDKIEYRNHLRQIGLAYNQIVVTTGKGPKNGEELIQALDGSRQIKELLDKGYVVVIYGVRPNQMTSSNMIAYEPDMDVSGVHLVLMGDGSVQDLNEVDFAKCPRAK